ISRPIGSGETRYHKSLIVDAAYSREWPVNSLPPEAHALACLCAPVSDPDDERAVVINDISHNAIGNSPHGFLGKHRFHAQGFASGRIKDAWAGAVEVYAAGNGHLG